MTKLLMVRVNQHRDLAPAIPPTMAMSSVNVQYRSVKYDSAQQLFGKGVSLCPNNLLCYGRPPRNRSIASVSSNSMEPSSTTFTTYVATPQSSPLPRNLTDRHILFLNFIACAAGISATCLFCSVIPTLLAFKRAAESLEKLLDVTREELPDTMAAVRLSGMEISDLTMELSDLGQEITQGVKNSTRAVRLAEERFRRLTNMNPSASTQVVKPEAAGAVVARTAKGIRENIVRSRAFIHMVFSITQFSKVAFKFMKSRAKSKA